MMQTGNPPPDFICAGFAMGKKQLVSKAQVAAEARVAAMSGQSALEACRFPLYSEAGRHFKLEFQAEKDAK